MSRHLSEERRRELVADLQALFLDEFDETLSELRARRLLDHFLESMAPAVYNRAIRDARAFLLPRLDDMEIELSDPDDAS